MTIPTATKSVNSPFFREARQTVIERIKRKRKTTAIISIESVLKSTLFMMKKKKMIALITQKKGGKNNVVGR